MLAIRTISGRMFDPWTSTAADVALEDIAHALSMVPRFAGHTPRAYSVAQHSLLCSYMVPTEYAREALLHDAHEAYVCDMPAPFKGAATMKGYVWLEKRVELLVRGRFGVPTRMSPVVKAADMRMLATEAREFGFPWHQYTSEDHLPYDELRGGIVEMEWRDVRREFLNRAEELGIR